MRRWRLVSCELDAGTFASYSFETSSRAWSAWACNLKLEGHKVLRALESGFRPSSGSAGFGGIITLKTITAMCMAYRFGKK